MTPWPSAAWRRSASVLCGSFPAFNASRMRASMGSALITASIANSRRPTTSSSLRGTYAPAVRRSRAALGASRICATFEPTRSLGPVSVIPFGKTSWRSMNAIGRLGKLASTPSIATCILKKLSYIAQVRSGTSSFWHPSSWKRFTVADIM